MAGEHEQGRAAEAEVREVMEGQLPRALLSAVKTLNQLCVMESELSCKDHSGSYIDNTLRVNSGLNHGQNKGLLPPGNHFS